MSVRVGVRVRVGVGEDVVPLDGGNTLANPDRIHLVGRVRPHLVRDRVGLGVRVRA